MNVLETRRRLLIGQNKRTSINLFDISADKYSGNAILVGKTKNSITVKSAAYGNYISYNAALDVDIDNLVGKTFTIYAKCKQTDNVSRGAIRMQFTNSYTSGNGATGNIYAIANMPSGATEGILKAKGTINSLPDFEINPTAKLCLLLYSNSNGTGNPTTEITYSDIMVVEGDYTDQELPYAPY